MITLSKIEAIRPKACEDRLDNYKKYYAKKEFTPAQFLGLKNITQADKMWVAFRLMPQENVRFAAADIAESVLHIYESKYPNDNRPRKAIEAARGGDKDAAWAAGDAARAAARAAWAAAGAARDAQEKLIRKICLRYWKDEKENQK